MKKWYVYIFASLLFGACSEIDDSTVRLQDFQLPGNVEISLVAKESMIEAPIALDFDEQGRMWVCEMQSYMPNIEGTDEQDPISRILILGDKNKDGEMDKVSIFLDSLVLPRAILLAYNGLLYAEPPNLWFVEIENDKPGKKTLVDSTYALKGNVEHQPNALMMNVDNWIYSATCNTRYRYQDGKWKREYTYPRGQWGMTKDKYGHLIYNNNSTLLAGDLVLPNALFGNPNLKLEDGYSHLFTTNQKVFPIQATAVNRGYEKGVLDEKDFLVNTTSACGPLIYYGDALPEEYNGAAFVCLPEINAIKCLTIDQDNFSRTASPIVDSTEFLITMDEGFRPVNIYNGPNGIYIIDFHRGIIQHKAYMTSYLREKILGKKLDTIAELGRIYRITASDYKVKPDFNISDDPITYLQSPNVWYRDKAQEYIIANARKDLEGKLIQLVKQSQNEVVKIHAIYALEGLGLLKLNTLLESLNSSFPFLTSHILHLLKDPDFTFNESDFRLVINRLTEEHHPAVDLALASSLQSLNVYSAKEYSEIIKTILGRNTEESLFAEAVLSDNYNKEDLLTKVNSTTLQEKIEKMRTSKPPSYYDQAIPLEDRRTVGMELYHTQCATCHGMDGEGRKLMAPPLLDSEYVSGSDERLILLTLHGMHGPITVNNVDYQFNAAMPGISENKELSNTDIKDILHFVRNAFASAPYSITESKIQQLRSVLSTNSKMYTAESLDSVVNLLSN